MLFGTKVAIDPGRNVLHGDPAPPPKKGAQPPIFRPMSIVAKRSPISATAEHLFTVAHVKSYGTNGVGKRKRAQRRAMFREMERTGLEFEL